MAERTTTVSRRLRDLCEPIASCVYFAPEAQQAYEELGLDYVQGYFCSRGACLGHPSGQLVAATFGVFNPAIVLPAVNAGWSKATPEEILDARRRGAVAALERMLGEVDPTQAVTILRPVMESVEVTGRPLFAGLRSLPFPDEPLAQLWRVCDYVRERRGDGHIAAWVSAGLDPVEIGLLTELYWGLEPASYIRTRGWSSEEIEAGYARLTARGLVQDRAFTPEGSELRRQVERRTDELDADVVQGLGEDAEELFTILDPWTRAILDAGGYPVDPSQIMSGRTRNT